MEAVEAAGLVVMPPTSPRVPQADAVEGLYILVLSCALCWHNALCDIFLKGPLFARRCDQHCFTSKYNNSEDIHMTRVLR